jgi:hypothetical protein
VSEGIQGIVVRLGLFRTLKWLAKAPFSYLNDIHSLEVAYFSFDQHQQAKASYPRAVSYYEPFLPKVNDGSPSFLFSLIIKLLTKLFSLKLFHLLTALIVFLCVLIVFLPITPIESRMLAFYSVGTFLMFSYVNPHVPFRFLMQIATPGFFAILVFLSSNRPKGV